MTVNTPMAVCEKEIGRLKKSMNHGETTMAKKLLMEEYLTSNTEEVSRSTEIYQLPSPSPSPSPRSTSPSLVPPETPSTELNGSFGKERSNTIFNSVDAPTLHGIGNGESHMGNSFPPSLSCEAFQSQQPPCAEDEPPKRLREKSTTSN